MSDILMKKSEAAKAADSAGINEGETCKLRSDAFS
jgi:hypothetical protein